LAVLDRKLLDILVCPVCKAEVTLNKAKDGLVCDKCKLEYPIQDDIPVMLPDEARSLEGEGGDAQ
jgi:hypothetical protein